MPQSLPHFPAQKLWLGPVWAPNWDCEQDNEGVPKVKPDLDQNPYFVIPEGRTSKKKLNPNPNPFFSFQKDVSQKWSQTLTLTLTLYFSKMFLQSEAKSQP